MGRQKETDVCEKWAEQKELREFVINARQLTSVQYTLWYSECHHAYSWTEDLKKLFL